MKQSQPRAEGGTRSRRSPTTDDDQPLRQQGWSGPETTLQRSLGNQAVQHHHSQRTEQGDVDRFPPETLELSEEGKQFLKLREDIAIVGGRNDRKIPKTDHQGNEIQYEEEVAPYDDGRVAGQGHATIGWGRLIYRRDHTCNDLREQGLMPEEYDTGITRSRADELFQEDVRNHAQYVKDAIEVDLSQNEFDALVSFTFNLGRGHMNPDTETNSSLLTAVNDRDQEAVVEAFKLYRRGGQVPRRMMEAAIFVHGEYDVRYDERDIIRELESQGYKSTSLREEGVSTLGEIARNYGLHWRDLNEVNTQVDTFYDGDYGSLNPHDVIVIPPNHHDEEAASMPVEESEIDAEEPEEATGGESLPMGYIITSLSAHEDFNLPGDIARAYDMDFEELSAFNATQDNSWDGNARNLRADQEVRVPLEGMVIEGQRADPEHEPGPEAEATIEGADSEPGLLDRLQGALERGVEFVQGLIGGTEVSTEEEYGDSDAGWFTRLREGVGRTIGWVRGGIGRGVEAGRSALRRGADTLRGLFASSKAESDDELDRERVEHTIDRVNRLLMLANTGQEDDSFRDLDDLMAQVIERETKRYQNLTVEVDGEVITVEPQYYMRGRGRPALHDRESTGFPDVSLRDAEGRPLTADAQFMGVAEHPDPGVYRNFDYTKNQAVMAGKSSPEVLERFIQGAIDAGVITGPAGIDEPLSENTRQKVQQWVDMAGVGVDCSGLVAHMITSIRGEALERGSEFDEDLELPDDPMAAEDLSGQARIMNRGSGAFRENPVSRITDLRPGDVRVTPGHVEMVMRIEARDDTVEVTIVESTGTRAGESGWGNELVEGRMRGGIQVKTEEFQSDYELTNFYRPTTLLLD